jgi:hypothetical protein
MSEGGTIGLLLSTSEKTVGSFNVSMLTIEILVDDKVYRWRDVAAWVPDWLEGPL